MATKGKTPAVRYLRYDLVNSGTPNTETSHYINLARDLSAINRRMYSGQRVYHVNRITIVSRNTVVPPQTTAGRITAVAAPNSWVVREAAKYGENLWNKMLNRALASSATVGKSKGRYHDFKIRGLHSGAPSPTWAIPLDNGGNQLQYGEWSYAEFYSPDGTTAADGYFCHLLGTHDPNSPTPGTMTSVSLVESFGNNRATVSNETPTMPTEFNTDPLNNLFDDGTVIDEILQHVEGENDTPPYDLDAYAGSADNMRRPLVMSQGCIADGSLVMNGMAVVCGMMEFEISSPIAGDTYSVLIELKEGSYKGIAAEAL